MREETWNALLTADFSSGSTSSSGGPVLLRAAELQLGLLDTRSRMQGMPKGRNLPGCFFRMRTCNTGFGAYQRLSEPLAMRISL